MLALPIPVINCEETFGETIKRLRGTLGGDDEEVLVVFAVTPRHDHTWGGWPETLHGGT